MCHSCCVSLCVIVVLCVIVCYGYLVVVTPYRCVNIQAVVGIKIEETFRKVGEGVLTAAECHLKR